MSTITLVLWFALNPGPGKDLVLTACVQCHDLRWIESQQKSEAAWRRTVNEMIWRGAPLIPGEVDVITKYLSTPPTLHPLSASGARALPPGAGRNLVIATCVQCHDLAITTSARKTLTEWRISVERMAHLGAKLNGREIEVAAQYLAKEFGK
jgi:mono/diheme cytochrome c family protein